MRAREFLIEYSRDKTLQTLGDRLVEPAQRDRDRTPEQVLAGLEAMDPTPNKQYVVWLARQYIAGQFYLEDAGRVSEVMRNYIGVKSRLPVEQRDLNRLDFYRLDKLIDKIYNVELAVEPQQTQGTFPVVPNSQVLYNGPFGQLAIPETEKACQTLGAGTKWCISAQRDNMFEYYNQKGNIYIWRDRSGDKYAFHFERGAFTDARNRRLSKKQLARFRLQHPITSKLFAQREAQLLQNPELAYVYTRDVIGGRWPEAEPIIAQNPRLAYYYAQKVIGDRWPEAEPILAKNPEWAYEYARDFIRDRWPEAEPWIAKNPRWAYAYARRVIGGRWPEAEPILAKNPEWAYEYAQELLKPKKRREFLDRYGLDQTQRQQ